MTDLLWLGPADCDPPHRVTHPERLEKLCESLEHEGWLPNEPCLLGYRYRDRVQLISGSHRHAAAARLDILLPVRLIDAKALWGTDEWVEVVRNPPAIKDTGQPIRFINPAIDLKGLTL